MKQKHIFIFLTALLFLTGCGTNSLSESSVLSSMEVSSSESSLETTSSSETSLESSSFSLSSEVVSSSEESSVVESGFEVSFQDNEFVTLTVYTDRDLETVDTSLPYMSRDKEGNYSTVDAEINFKLVLTEGYFIEKFQITGTYNKIKNPADLEIDDAYRITGIESNLSVSFVVTNAQTGFKATFNVDPLATLTVYTDKDYKTVDTDSQIQTRDGGEYSKNPEQAQLNFMIVVPEGYEAIVTATEDAYKNIKGPDECGENCWRITKINADIVVTITVEESAGPQVNGYKATFDIDEGVKEIQIFKDIDAWDNLDIYTVGLEAISTQDGVDSKGSNAQINFIVILKDNFIIKSVTATEGCYKNLKTPKEDGYPANGYRLTKVTSDLTVTITTEAI